MTTPIGAQGKMGIRKEASFASGGAVDNWQPFISESLSLTFNNDYSDLVQDTPEQVYGQQGNESVSGNVVFPVSPQNPSQWWTCGLGQSTSPFYAARPLSSMLIQLDKETAAIQASGCMINGLTFSSSQGGILTCSVDIEAAGIGSVTAGAGSFTSDDPAYLHREASFYLNNTLDTSITAFSVAINNNLQTDLYGTGRQRLDIPAGKLVVNGSFTKLFDDTTERNAFLNAQARSFKVTFARGARSFIINCPEIRYNSRPDNISGQSEYILETFNFTGYTSTPASTNSIRISGDTVG